MSNGSGSGTDYSSLSMHDLFRMEAENQTAILAQGLLDLEKDAMSSDKLETLMRASHSVKGAARIVGIDAVVGLAHELEDCFVAAQRRELQLTSDHIDLFLQVVDTIVQIAHLDEAQTQQWLDANQQQIDHLKNRLNAILSVAVANTVEPTPDAIQNHESLPPAPAPGFAPGSVEFQSSAEQGANGQSRAAGERVIRISADRLTRIMGLSSEILVESGWLRPFTDSMVLLKKRHAEMSNVLEALKESVSSNAVSERVRTQLLDLQRKLTDCRTLLSERLVELDDYDRRNSNLSSNMYNEVVASRMRPLADGIPGMRRMVRDMARDLNKKVNLQIEGEDTLVDRDILEKAKAPLTHLLRNAIDHGIETPRIRKNKNKHEEGLIRLSASHIGGMLTIIVEDDGQGIDLNKLKKKVISRGLTTREIAANLSETELLEFLFLPDFSTKTKVTEFSGRGVGLDVVRSLVQEMRGKVNVFNNSGYGLKFVLQLPLTLSVITTLLVDIAGEPYAFPLSRVDHLLTVPPDQVKTVEGRQYISMDGDLVGLVPASHVLELEPASIRYDEFHVVVIGDQFNRYGVVVDRFIGQRELSVQSLDSRLGKVQDISAASLTEDGIPVLVIDVDDLVRSIDAVASGGPISALKPYTDVLSQKLRKRILVVDDSLTVREIERKLLESHGYRVDVAVDGMDGWNAVRRVKYDLVVTDVDMPRLDGIELVRYIKSDSHLSSLPIMIVSYKDRQEDRQRGLDAGADYYLAKGSFHDETLVEAVEDLVGDASE
ncbi:MAG: hybrid sensor histidine kinase/response regulator [Gammaproteobacteria bacterium]